MAYSSKFCQIIDNISLKFAIQTMEASQRIIVGTIFLFWYFNNRLQAIFAWIAGPGDIISGILAFYAIQRLNIFKQIIGLKNEHKYLIK